MRLTGCTRRCLISPLSPRRRRSRSGTCRGQRGRGDPRRGAPQGGRPRGQPRPPRRRLAAIVQELGDQGVAGQFACTSRVSLVTPRQPPLPPAGGRRERRLARRGRRRRGGGEGLLPFVEADAASDPAVEVDARGEVDGAARASPAAARARRSTRPPWMGRAGGCAGGGSSGRSKRWSSSPPPPPAAIAVRRL